MSTTAKRNSYRLLTRFPGDILDRLPKEYKQQFGEGKFVCTSTKNKGKTSWLPALEIGPFDIEPNPKLKQWMYGFEKDILLHLVLFCDGNGMPQVSLASDTCMMSYDAGLKQEGHKLQILN